MKRANFLPLFQKEKLEDHGNYRLVCLILVLGKVTGEESKKKTQPTNQSQMEAISKLIKLTGNSQPKSAISKSSLTTLFAFSDEMTTSE